MLALKSRKFQNTGSKGARAGLICCQLAQLDSDHPNLCWGWKVASEVNRGTNSNIPNTSMLQLVGL